MYTPEHGEIWLNGDKREIQFKLGDVKFSVHPNEWYVAGENLAIDKFVSIADAAWATTKGNASWAGRVFLTDSGTVEKTVGIVVKAATAGNPVEVLSQGLHMFQTNVFSASDIGKTAYIAPGASDGGMTTDRILAVSSGNQLIECGIVKSLNELYIDFEGDSRGGINLSQLEYTTGEAITCNNAPKVVCQLPDGKIYLADKRKSVAKQNVVGFIVGASSNYDTTVPIDTSAVVHRLGTISSTEWTTLVPGKMVYCHNSGGITQSIDALSYYTDYIIPLGVAKTANSIYVDVGEYKETSDYNEIGAITARPAAGPDSEHLACDGSNVSRTTYAELFTIIGTTFGAGDGSTTFTLPTSGAVPLQIKYKNFYIQNPSTPPLFRIDTDWAAYSKASLQYKDIDVSVFGYDAPLEDLFVEVYVKNGATYRKIDPNPVIYTLVGTPTTYSKYGYQVVKTTANTVRVEFSNDGLAYFDRTSGNYISVDGWQYRIFVYKTERYNKFYDYTADKKLSQLWSLGLIDYTNLYNVQMDGKFDRSTTNPNVAHTTRLNYDGNLHVGKLYSYSNTSVSRTFSSATSTEENMLYSMPTCAIADTGTKTGFYTGANVTNTSGSLTAVVGVKSVITQNGSGGTLATARMFQAYHVLTAGTTTNSYGLFINNATGAGTLTNQYGIYIENLTKGTTVNTPIYSLGTGQSYLAGSLKITSSLATDSTSFDLINATATTLNIGGAATTLNIGATSGNTWIRGSNIQLGSSGNDGVNIRGNIYVKADDGTTNNVYIDNQTGNISMSGDLTVSGGDITIGADHVLTRVDANLLRVTNGFSIANNLFVDGGTITIGADCSLYRSSADVLRTDDSLIVGGSATITGNTTVNGIFKVNGSTKTDGSFYTGTTDPTNVTRLNYDGYLYATKVINSVWNDIADMITVEEDTVIEMGRVYVYDGTKHKIATKYAEKGTLGISSDTYGFGVGRLTNARQIPIAVGGYVLAHTKVYPSGTPLTSSYDGSLVKASLWTRLFNPERILATFYKEEHNELWNNLLVKGRHWVKVR